MESGPMLDPEYFGMSKIWSQYGGSGRKHGFDIRPRLQA